MYFSIFTESCCHRPNETRKHCKENRADYLYYLELYNGFLDLTTKVPAGREKISKLEVLTIKNFSVSRNAIRNHYCTVYLTPGHN